MVLQRRNQGDGEGDVRRCRNTPAMERIRCTFRDCEIDKGRCDKSSKRRDKRHNRLARVAEAAAPDFLVNFDSHQQEKQHHEPIIDPVVKAFFNRERSDAQPDRIVQHLLVNRGPTEVDEKKRRDGSN
jgi:hypothetical protein